MKIAIVGGPYIPVPPKKYGGTELVIYYLIKGLKEEGHDVILLGPGDSTVDCQLISTVSKSIFFPEDPSELGVFNKRLAKIEAQTKDKLKAIAPKVDIIHSMGFDLLDFRKFPSLTTLHGPITFPELGYYLERKDLNFVSISKNQQEALPELNWMAAVYNGEDPTLFPIITDPDDYVCFIGRFDREKTPHLAIALAINLGIKIKLAGKTDFLGYEYFEQEIKPYLKNPLVEYLGEIGFEEKIDLLSKAKCNLHPTGFREPFGLTVMEAAYCGTPTLAIARGSMPELIKEGLTGMLVEDYVEGYHQIEQCFSMDRSYIAKRSRSKFNYMNMTRGYLRVYDKVMRQHWLNVD
ncbi:MAG: glycosyltransferase family 4 protein [Candidatus Saccharimonadales bacterium]